MAREAVELVTGRIKERGVVVEVESEMPVVSVEAHTVGGGRPGEVTIRLIDKLEELLAKQD